MSSSRKMLLKSYDAFCNSPPARVTKVFSLGEKQAVKRTVNSNGSLSRCKWRLWILFTSNFSQHHPKMTLPFLSCKKNLLFHLIFLYSRKVWIFFGTVLFFSEATYLHWLLSCKDVCSVSNKILLGQYNGKNLRACLHWDLLKGYSLQCLTASR